MSQPQTNQSFLEEARDALLATAREASTAAATQAIIIRQQLGTGTHLLQAMFALAARRQLGGRTLVIQPGAALLDYTAEETRRLAGDEQIATVRSVPHAAYCKKDFLVTNSHAARVGAIADNCPKGYFGIIIFDQVGGFAKKTLAAIAREFASGYLHLYWNPEGRLPFLDSRRIPELKPLHYGSVIKVAAWPGDYAAALAETGRN
jgi:hypothetical protein